ncbi:MAG: hypothetical protein E4H13_11460 [Calditrichales bacterium]|nr:MAG: hypothetical protein E4H13_11460 [Calditrichales bacterium]
MLNKNKTRLLVFTAILLFMNFKPSAYAEDTSMISWKDILPREINGWHPVRADEQYDRDTIFEYMNGAGELYLAYDFKNLMVREYEKTSAPSVIVEIYQMSSSRDAFGIYTQDLDGDPVEIGKEAIYAKGLLRFWQGDVFCRILAFAETENTRQLVLQLGRRIAGSIPTKSEKPAMLQILPSENLLPDDIHYFHTSISLNTHYYLANHNILDLDRTTQALLARYKKSEKKFRLLVVSYPNDERAGQALRQFARVYMKIDSTDIKGQVITRIEDNTYISAGNSGRFTYFIFEAATQEDCRWLGDRLIKKIEEGTDE